MSYALEQYPGDGSTTNFSVPFPYISTAHVKVRLDSVLQTEGVDYTWLNVSTIQMTVAPGASEVLELRRESSRDERIVNYEDASTVTEATLDQDANQLFYIAQEAFDTAENSIQLASDGTWNAANRRIKGVADGTEADHAATKGQLDAAALSPVTPAASSISNTPSGNLAAGNVQAALNELQGDVDSLDSLKAPKASPAFTGTPTAPTPAVGTDSTQLATTAFVNERAGATVRQTALFGAVNSSGYANFLSAGSGLRLSLAASAVALALSYSNGMKESVEQISADSADIIGSNLPASNTSFIYKTLGGAWGSAIIPPQYGYAYDRTASIVLNFAGTNGQTSTVDEGGNTWTFTGNAQIATDQFKFGSSSLKLDGTGDYISCADFKSVGDGMFESVVWFRPTALPASTAAMLLFSAHNGAGFGFRTMIYNDTVSTKIRLAFSADGTSEASPTGTSSISAGTWYRMRVVRDVLAGNYKGFLSVNGAAETLEFTYVNTAAPCAFTEVRVGANNTGIGGFNGHLGSVSFTRAMTSPSALTPSAVAPSITDHPIHFFSIPEMKMYEATGASSVAGTNPTMTRRDRLFLGEADTGASSVTAVRPYALRGEYRSPITALQAVNGLVTFAHNIGVVPQDVKLFLIAKVEQSGYKVGDRVIPQGGAWGGANQQVTNILSMARMTAYAQGGSSDTTATYQLAVRGTGGRASCSPTHFDQELVANRGW
jgi:hypothetical protein